VPGSTTGPLTAQAQVPVNLLTGETTAEISAGYTEATAIINAVYDNLAKLAAGP
jgi:hypothetical protein